MRRTTAAALALLPLAMFTAHARAASDDDDEFAEPPPKTWAEVGTRYQTECPTPFFNLAQPEKVKAGGSTWTIHGSEMIRDGGAWKGPLRIGVLGAVKEASKETRENIRRAWTEFEKRGVNIVLANGDVSEGEFDLEDAFTMVAEEVKVPIFVHIGNSEGKGSFTRAFLKTQKAHPEMFNMNWIRHVDFGGVHLFSLPGYYNLRFLHGKAGCHYKPKDVDALRKVMSALPKDHALVLTAHGPPHSFSKEAIDFAFDAGNVGDPALTDLVESVPVPFGIFGHILEAGGRVTSDLKTGVPTKLPMKSGAERLYINAGSASAQPWMMLNNKSAYGMAAVFTVEGTKGSVEFLTLRKN